MDAPLHPPLRISALSSKPLTKKATQKRLETFLQDFEDRATAAHSSGQTTASVQVRKLKEALKDALNEPLKQHTHELKEELNQLFDTELDTRLVGIENSLKTISQLCAIVRDLASRGYNLCRSLRSNRTVIIARGPTSFPSYVFRLTTGPILLSIM